VPNWSDAGTAIRELFQATRPLGSAAWTAELRNGRVHDVQVAIRAGVTEIATTPRKLGRSPSELAFINAALPPGCRVVCTCDGTQLVAEAAIGAMPAAALERAVLGFQEALDILGGAATTRMAALPWCEDSASADGWQLEERPDGSRETKLPHKRGALAVRVSEAGSTVLVAKPAAFEIEVREAVSEVLLRATAKVRFVRACARPEGETWSAWIEVPDGVCILDEALTALALVCRDCGTETAALTDPGLAAAYRKVSSVF